MEAFPLHAIPSASNEEPKNLTSMLQDRTQKGDLMEEAKTSQMDNTPSRCRASVFELMEYGLKKNPDQPAVICTFQNADALTGLVCETRLPSQGQNGSQPSANGSNPPCLTLTYAQLHETALRLATGLLAHGVRPNTKLLMLIPNGGEYAIMLWACILLRITFTSLDPALLKEPDGTLKLKNMISILQPQVIIAPDALSCKALDKLTSELNLPEPVIRLNPTRLSTLPWTSIYDVVVGVAMHAAEQDELVNAARYDDPDRIYNIMFTSGTSGNPKGCPMRVNGMSYMLISQSWLIDAEAGARALQQAHNSRGIAPAQIVQTWKAGGAVVMTGQNLDVHSAIDAIKRFRITFLVMTPPMVHEIAAELATGPCDTSSIKNIQIGGDAVTKEVMMKCARLFPHSRICVNHGMTEGGGSFEWPFFDQPVHSIPFFGEICPIGTVALETSIRIWETENDRAVGRGELGELHISCPSIIKGYLNNRSEESFYYDSDGTRWFRTGDSAMLNKEGIVFILGRSSTMIKRKEVAIMPAVIESSVARFTGSQVSLPSNNMHVQFQHTDFGKKTIVVSVVSSSSNAEPFAVTSSYNGKSQKSIQQFVVSSLGKDYELYGTACLDELGLSKFPLNPTHKIMKSKVQEIAQRYIGHKRRWELEETRSPILSTNY